MRLNAQSAKAVPEPTLKRLPLYHRYVKQLCRLGKVSISCTEIGGEFKLDPTQVRKDLEAIGLNGRPRIGYGAESIVGGIEDFLGWNKANEAFLVGAGSMGAALLGYQKFEECGLQIVAAFDLDPRKIGLSIRGKRVLHLDKLPGLARRMRVLLGVITVPAEAAQEVAELMVSGGIRALWNFAPVQLRLPGHVIVHNEDLFCSLASLSRKLARELQTAGDVEPAAVTAHT
jgi:redox-sensing transcriptional repressor